MKISRDSNTIRCIAVFMTLLYAFTTRSILAKFLFQNQIELLLFYGITYACLIISFGNAFDANGGHLYAPKGFYSIAVLFIVIAMGLGVTGNSYSLIYYGLALLLPFSMNREIKQHNFFAKFFVGMALFFAVGCFVNFLIPAIFKAVFIPLYSASAQQSLADVEQLAGTSTYFAGFTSQVGYTSFFISIGVGAAFCFKDSVFARGWRIFIGIMLGGLLLTGKRGPLFFLLIALSIIYFTDGYGRERIVRTAQIVGALILAYIALSTIANLTKIDGIIRIYDAVHEFLTSGSVEDAGRNQLHEQALYYFKEKPILGIGWSNFRELYAFRGTHVHCIYLQILCETGLVGFCIFMVFFLTRLLRTFSAVKESRFMDTSIENGWVKFSLFIQIYFLLYGITGNPLYDIEETIIYFFAIGISYIPLFSFSEE